MAGPTLGALAGSEVPLNDGGRVIADAAYLAESIREPRAKVVEGFQPLMPDLALDEATVADLVAYIETLR